MKKMLIFLVTLLVVVGSVNAASLRQMQLEIVDEFWQPVTDITQISIFDAGTSSATTISSDRSGSLSMTNPITTGSTNSTFDQATGFVRWYQRASTYKVTITNGTKTLTIDDMNATFIRFPWFVSYIGTAASLSVNDNQTISVGTDGDMKLSWVNASDLMNWIPLSDGSAFNLGSTTVTKQVDFNVFVGGIGGGGLAVDEGNATFIWTGGAFSASGGTINLNASSNNVTNINTGSSTAAVNIGSSAAGNITLDTTDAMVLNADDSIAVTTSAGTIDIDSTGGDLGIAATDKSILIDAGETAVDDAIIIQVTGAASGMRIISLADIDITTTGASGEDISLVNTGGSIILTATEGATDAIDINATGVNGGIDLDTSNGPITITAVSTTAGDITIAAGDILTLTHVDKIIYDGASAETWEIEGAANEHETTIVFTNPSADVTYTFPTAGAQTVAIWTSTLTTNAPEVANSVWGGTSQIIAEGSTADAWETTIAFSDVGADVTYTFQEANSGSILISSSSTFTTDGTMAASQAWGGVHSNTGQTGGSLEIELPSAVTGMEFTFYVTVATPVSLDPDGSDIILNHTNTAGDKITSAAESGTWITLHAISTSAWAPISVSGTWSDGGA